MSGAVAAVACAGGISTLDTQTVTKGTASSGTDPFTEYAGFRSIAPTCGSISDSTSNVYSGATITGLFFTQSGGISPPVGYYTRQLMWRLSSEVANSGWTTMLVGSTTFLRADATFNTGTGYSQWTWNIAIPDPYLSEGDPFTSSTTVIWY